MVQRAAPRSVPVARAASRRRTWRTLRRALTGLVLVACVAVGFAIWLSRSAEDEPERLPLGLSPRNDAPPAPPPTMVGGVELVPVEPASLFVGRGLSFGSPLPSTALGIGELAAAPEVRGTTVRQVHDRASGERLAEMSVLSLDGAAFFDRSALGSWITGFVGRLAGDVPTEVEVAELRAVSAGGGSDAVLGFRRGDALVVLRGEPSAVEWVTALLVQAHGAGADASEMPATPAQDLPVAAAFVEVPGVEFPPFPTDEPEAPPAPPSLPGTDAVEGRIGAVGGERRTTVWSIGTDEAVYPAAEALAPAIDELVGSRAGGAEVTRAEVAGRVVAAADGPPGGRAVRAFRHERLVLVVEGLDPAQVDAVATAWATALG